MFIKRLAAPPMRADPTETSATHDNCDMASDPRWPTAAAWLRRGPLLDGVWQRPAVSIIGFGSQRRSLSPTNAGQTPRAVRAALNKYSTWHIDRDIDIWDVLAADFADISNPDSSDGFERSIAILRSVRRNSDLALVIGGDNSITYPAMLGLHTTHPDSAAVELGRCGLITFDAHHDLRDGWSNGSPVRQLVEAGLPGAQIVQIGIAGFANSREYTRRARDLGITIITRDEAHARPVADVIEEALDRTGAGGGSIHLDVDMDVCDRSVVPACPASSPGGFSAERLRHMVFTACRDERVTSVDFTEVDATADAPDGRTVRLVALSMLEAVAGFATRTMNRAHP